MLKITAIHHLKICSFYGTAQLRSVDIIAQQAVRWCQPHGDRERGDDQKTPANKISGKDVDSRIQVQREQDGGGNTEQNRAEKSGLWATFHQEQQSCEVKKVMTQD